MYGITNCDTVKKARAHLSGHGVAFDFHDYKKLGMPSGALAQWMAALGWEALLNRKGNTWRRLDEAQRAAVTDAASALGLMLQEPSVIKRPVVEWGAKTVTVGFDSGLFTGALRDFTGSARPAD